MSCGAMPGPMMGAPEPARCAQVLVAGPDLGVQRAPDVVILPPLRCGTGMTDAEIEAYARKKQWRYGQPPDVSPSRPDPHSGLSSPLTSANSLQ